MFEELDILYLNTLRVITSVPMTLSTLVKIKDPSAFMLNSTGLCLNSSSFTRERPVKL